jgi:prepilin-type N-terminal cleavage/methylation domain-containing protein/prepilin-type processing-associated H-X9-DG protein
MCARWPRRTKNGFTLVELLVVIAVLATLVVLVFPTVQGVLGSSKAAGCVSNMRQIGVGLIAFANDNRGYLPRTTYYSDQGVPNEYWTTRIKSYLDFDGPSLQVGQTILRCPARPPHNPSQGENYTYGLNYGKVSAFDGDYYDDGRGRIQPLVKLGSKVYLMADAHALNIPLVLWPGPTGHWPLTADRNGDGIPDTAPGEAADYNGIEFIHQNGKAANFLFGDGSVRMYTIRQWAENEGGMWGTPW